MMAAALCIICLCVGFFAGATVMVLCVAASTTTKRVGINSPQSNTEESEVAAD